jgi:hypothetical protein
MKILNTKIAVQTFGALLLLEAVLFTLLYQVPSDWTRMLWWSVNWPAYSLGRIVGRYLFSHGVITMESTLMIGIGLFCALIWSALFGVVYRIVRRKAVA